MHYSNFDMDHWIKVRTERIKLGLPVRSKVVYIESDLVGKTIKNRDTQKVYTVEGVYKDWYQGWFHVAVYVDSNGSHGTVVIHTETDNPNISCHNFATNYEVL